MNGSSEPTGESEKRASEGKAHMGEVFISAINYGKSGGLRRHCIFGRTFVALVVDFWGGLLLLFVVNSLIYLTCSDGMFWVFSFCY